MGDKLLTILPSCKLVTKPRNVCVKIIPARKVREEILKTNNVLTKNYGNRKEMFSLSLLFFGQTILIG